MTFDQCATAYISAHRSGWKNEKHIGQWENTLEAYASPIIGTLPVAEVDTALVVKVLGPIWETKTEAAYWRGDLLDKRVQLMKAWADYCVKPQAEASVTPIGKQRKTTKRPA